ncbi:hypothetical protein LO80_05395 [Candidatus Francisella endociliophora]|uniref:Lipoprotein n=1 Tax=Candidatus Francisella endociliophora TaxID=653937 RepID=A0A097EPG3_9GAMM|nr:hypothetical protein [Francisella sp. FSC1006]AIT09455.1 hypothetical protein LO80_05395 [Francisella sp. FSC1006]
MKKALKTISILAATVALGVALSSCTDDATARDSITLTGTYNGTGSGTQGGWSWNITSSKATITCPSGTFIPNAIRNNPPVAGDMTEYTYGGDTATGSALDLDTSTSPVSVIGAIPIPLVSGETADITNGPSIVDMVCVPAASVDNFTA